MNRSSLCCARTKSTIVSNAPSARAIPFQLFCGVQHLSSRSLLVSGHPLGIIDKLYSQNVARSTLKPTGEIQLIVGPMFAGKSTEMLRRVRRFEHARLRCMVIKFIDDNRYESETGTTVAAGGSYVSTHDTTQAMKAFPTRELMEVKALLDDYDVVGIDEGQFFPDLIEFCELAASLNKIVIVAALDGTFQRAPFGQVCDLVAKSESVSTCVL